MDNLRNDRIKVFEFLAATEGVVKASTAATINGAVHADYVVVHEASPRVVRELVNNFVMVGLTSNGLLIPVNRPTD